MTQLKRPLLVLLGLLFLLPAMGQAMATVAEIENDDVQSFDEIVKELSSKPTHAQAKTRAKAANQDPLGSVLLHAGVGLANTFSTLNYAGRRLSMNQQGVQASLGIDLLSPRWLAEASARTFNDERQSDAQVGLQEFDLKVYYRHQMARRLGLRLGGGLAARYLSVRSGTEATREFTTPASIFAAGLDIDITRSMSIGAELNARSSLISDTIDRRAFDASVRFDTHF